MKITVWTYASCYDGYIERGTFARKADMCKAVWKTLKGFAGSDFPAIKAQSNGDLEKAYEIASNDYDLDGGTIQWGPEEIEVAL